MVILRPCLLKAVFGVVDDSEFKCKPVRYHYIQIAFACGRNLFIWKSTTPPCAVSLLEDILCFLKLEKG